MCTVNEAYDAYLLDLEERMTTAAHIRSVRSRLKPFRRRHGDTPLADLTRPDCARFLRDLESGGRSEATMAGYTATLKAFLKFAYLNEWTAENLGDRLKARDYSPQVRRPAPESHIQAVINALPEFVAHRDYQPRDIRDALLISLSIDSGARRGTMRNLQRADVEKALMSAERTEEGRVVYTVKTKGKTGTTEVVFFAETAELFGLWLPMVPGKSPYVFISLTTLKRLKPDALSKAYVRICEFADVPTFRSHAVRKRNTDRVIRLSDLEVGQRYAGHRQLSTTARYYRQLEHRDVYDAAARLAADRRGDGKFADAAAEFFGLSRDGD